MTSAVWSFLVLRTIGAVHNCGKHSIPPNRNAYLCGMFGFAVWTKRKILRTQHSYVVFLGAPAYNKKGDGLTVMFFVQAIEDNKNMNYEDIKAQRQKYGISQAKLAQFCNISPAIVSSWELGKIIPSQDQIDTVWACLRDLIFEIENNGLNIKKKNIKRAAKAGSGIPNKITSAIEYQSLMQCNTSQKSEYVKLLSSIYETHRLKTTETDPKAISLFSGCGGLDLGFSAAGFNIVGHVEIDPAAQNIYKANFPDSELLGGDVCQISDRDIDDWKNRFGKIDLLIGGPPCQGFSLAGKRDPNDIRNQLYQYYVKIVSKIHPKVFVMENVRLLISMKTADGDLLIDQIRQAFESVGYDISIDEINAQDFGVPQSRERVIIVGVRRGSTKRFVFPAATHACLKQCDQMQLSLDSLSPLKPYRTFRDATFDLASIESGERSQDPLHWSITHPDHVIGWLKNVPEGCSAHENADPNLRPSSGFNTTYKRIVWDEPCSTISTNFSMISGCRNVHPTATRSLTIREATRAQSFPDEFRFFGKWGDVRKVIGNAVPPLLAYVIATAVKEQLF